MGLGWVRSRRCPGGDLPWSDSGLSVHALVLLASASAFASEPPLEIGSRRELFVDDFLIGKLTGGAALHLHQPQPQEVVLVTDPWGIRACTTPSPTGRG